MTDEKSKKRSVGRYQFAVLAGMILLWKVIVGFHDIVISYDGSICVERYLGPSFYRHWKENGRWRKKNRWNEAAISFINTIKDPQHQKRVLEVLKQNCSRYFFVTEAITSSADNKFYKRRDIIMVNNWAFMDWGDPARSNKRINSMIFWAVVFLLCIVDFRKLIWFRKK